MILDTEGDHVIPSQTKRKPQPYFWHKYQLRLDGCTEDQIAQREQYQDSIGAEYARIKNTKTRQNQRPAFEQDSRDRGLVTSDVYSFQLACIQDDDDSLTCAAHLVNIINSVDGRTLPPSLFQLLAHPNVVWMNVGVENDIHALNRAFFEDKLSNVRFLDVKTAVEGVYGSPLPKREDVQGEGGLGLFQRVFSAEKLTWRKSPLITRSHWWTSDWDDGQVHYALMDVHSIAMMMRKLIPHMSLSPGAMSSTYPYKRANKSASRRGRKQRMDSVTAPFEFASSPNSDDDVFLRSSPKREPQSPTSANTSGKRAADKSRQPGSKKAKSMTFELIKGIMMFKIFLASM